MIYIFIWTSDMCAHYVHRYSIWMYMIYIYILFVTVASLSVETQTPIRICKELCWELCWELRWKHVPHHTMLGTMLGTTLETCSTPLKTSEYMWYYILTIFEATVLSIYIYIILYITYSYKLNYMNWTILLYILHIYI